MSHEAVTSTLQAVYSFCDHGGRLKREAWWDNKLIARFWVKADPQRNSDCS